MLDNNFKIDDLLSDLRNLNVKEYTDDDDLCRIEIEIDYTTGYLSLCLTSCDYHESENGQVNLFLTTQQTEDTTIYTIHTLIYACNEDKCEIEFLNKYLRSVLQDHYADLSKKLIHLILENNTVLQECFVDENIHQECFNGRCLASVTTVKDNQQSRYQKCIRDVNGMSPNEIRSQLIFDMDFKEINYTIDFHCVYNQCNSMKIVDQIVMNELYNLSNILKVFGYKKELEFSSTTGNTMLLDNETSLDNTTQTVNTTTPNNAAQMRNINGQGSIIFIACAFVLIVCV
ncbi:unnamed protein product [Adineta ricciae]|nr:unnamed protein product [Adineta ricciae]